MDKYKRILPIAVACVVLIFSAMLLNTAPALASTSLSISPVTSESSPGYVGQNITLTGVDFQPNATVTITYSNPVVVVATTTSDAGGDFVVDFEVSPSQSGVHTINASDGINSLSVPFYMEDQAPPTPQPISPETGAVTSPLVEFDWKNVSDESGVTYELCIATNISFNPGSITLLKTSLNESEYRLSESEALAWGSDDQPYYWRVRAVDGAENCSVWSRADKFYIGGSLTIDPDRGVVGTEVTIEGERFTPDEDLEVTYDGDDIDIVSGDNETDDSGDFAFTIIIPESTAGDHMISVTDDVGMEAGASFTVEPDMVLNLVTARPGDDVMIVGTGFGKSLDVDITIGNFRFVTDTNIKGSFEYQLEVPDLAEDTWNINAEDKDGNDTAVQLIIEEANVSIAPSSPTASPSEVNPGEEVTVTTEAPASEPSPPAPTSTSGTNWVILGPIIAAVFLAVFLPIRLRKSKR